MSVGQVQRLFKLLATHAELLEEAFQGSVSGGDKARNTALETLHNQNVLKPYDEGQYRLNPRLREFIADFLESYQAFQALRRVDGTKRQAMEQWEELRRLKSIGASKDLMRLQFAFDESIVEMAYSVEQNLALLHSLLTTQYGNVENLGSKLRQNKYYAKQVKLFLKDVDDLEVFAERVAEESIASGMPHIRAMVVRRLTAKRLSWTSQIKDAQAVISKRLFEAKLMEERLKRLSRFALWLGRDKTTSGWYVDIDESMDRALLRPPQLDIRPHPDVLDTDPITRENLLVAVAKLPPVKASPQPSDATQQEPQILVEDDEVIEEVLTPEQLALRDIATAVAHSEHPISLLDFKTNHAQLSSLSDESWLMFATLQLRANGFQIHYAQELELDPFPINERFYDVLVSGSPVRSKEVS